MDGDQQPNLVGPVRALAKTLTTPLTGLEQLLQEADTPLVALAPPLEHLIEFAPFARLTVSEPATQPVSTLPTARQSGTVPTLPSTAVPSASSNGPSTLPPARGQTALTGSEDAASGQAAPPVFSLSDRKRTAVAPLPSIDLSQPGIDRPLAAAIPVPEQSNIAAMPSTYLAQALPVADDPYVQTTAAPAPLPERALSPAAGPAPARIDGLSAPLAAMPLLALLTSALLATPPSTVAASRTALPLATSAASRQAPLFNVDNANVDNPTVDNATVDNPSSFAVFPQTAEETNTRRETVPIDTLSGLAAPSISASPAAAVAGFQADQTSDSFAGWSATAAAVAPPNAWTLAQLINEVLSAEAHRHGVDLS